MEITHLSPNLAVGAQIGQGDLKDLARAGFTDIVCNRPDLEHPEDPDASVMEDTAKELGLAFHYLPIAPSEAYDLQAQNLARLTTRPGAKVFAYCRSGARSTRAWALAKSEFLDAQLQA